MHTHSVIQDLRGGLIAGRQPAFVHERDVDSRQREKNFPGPSSAVIYSDGSPISTLVTSGRNGSIP